MKFIISILLVFVCFISFAQENSIQKINWEELNENIHTIDTRYTIEYREILPSLSFIKPIIVPDQYTLMIVDLTVDIRKKHLRDETPILQLPENKFIQSKYNVELPDHTQQRTATITITGSGGYSNNRYTNTNGVKNNAYKDASEYAAIYCPVTGVRLN